MLRHFFEPYVFEETAATGKRAQKVYLDAVGECDIYLGLIGEAYGNADAEGVSPTEREYDKAVIINPGSLLKGTTKEDLYRVHDSNPRNEVIALAMSWTSYVEKSGSGTGEIIDKCRDHGLATPIYDPTEGFFKTIIWRNGYGPAASRHPVGTKSRGRVKGPSQGPRKGPENWAEGPRTGHAFCS